nr:murein biosynthesis integral membrane protein MurJ [Betaproteobacteria bacterium]
MLAPEANAHVIKPLNLIRALSTVSGMTFISRVTGLLRESLKATLFGAGVQMDSFEAAFRLP